MLVRAPEITFPSQDVPIEPYLLGLWFGDGTCGVPEITNIEPEVHTYCAGVASKYGVEYKRLITNDIPKAVLSGRPGQFQYKRKDGQHVNPLTAVFRSCIVDDEKRIPSAYLSNSAEVRFELLAGLIDTDGHLGNGTYLITTKWAGLRDDILSLARSLGLAAYSYEHDGKIDGVVKGRYHTITISGHIERVPVKVSRKIAPPRRQVKDALRTGFRIEDAGIGEFLGFELDGDSRFLLADFTITHNSSGLRALCPEEDWFTDDLPLDADTKRQMESTAGKLIVEAGELKGMTKGDVNKLKGYLSRHEDKARMAYGRKEKISPRQFIIIGTTNDAQYLRDPTGNRRFWPVAIIYVDVDMLRRDREQLWAEAAYYESQGESIRLKPSLYGMAAEEQEHRRVVDTIELILEEALDGKVGRIKSTDIWNLLGKDPADAKPDEQMRMGEAMRRLGWEFSRPRVKGQRVRYYMKGVDDEKDVLLGVSGRKIVRVQGQPGLTGRANGQGELAHGEFNA